MAAQTPPPRVKRCYMDAASVREGTLITCDVPTRELILHLNETHNFLLERFLARTFNPGAYARSSKFGPERPMGDQTTHRTCVQEQEKE